MPHWPRPWGRDASAVEQLVIEQEFGAAGLKRPSYGITGWVILTLIQHGTPDQVERWVPAALNQEVIWCQLFSEPGRRLGRGRYPDQGDPGEGRWGGGRGLAGQRPEGVDQRRAPGPLRLRHRAHEPGRAQAPGHHHDGHRHEGPGRLGSAAARCRPGTRTSTRSSSTTCSSPTTTWSGRSTAAGRWPGPPSATRA